MEKSIVPEPVTLHAICMECGTKYIVTYSLGSFRPSFCTEPLCKGVISIRKMNGKGTLENG